MRVAGAIGVANLERTKERSMMLFLKNWRTVLGLALVTVLFCGLLYIKGIRAENARLAQANQISEAAIDRLEADLVANRKALETREAESKRLAQDPRWMSWPGFTRAIKSRAIGPRANCRTGCTSSYANESRQR